MNQRQEDRSQDADASAPSPRVPAVPHADEQVPRQRPAWVLLSEEARARGFRNVLAFRRWCRRRAVPIRTDGRKQWVAPADVDRAVATISPEAPGSDDAAIADVDPVASGVRDLMMQAGRRR